jgi:hypothetical protein
MKLKRAVILVCTWIFSVALAAATAQSIAQESPPQTSPDLTAVEKAIKQKSESARSIKAEETPPQKSPDLTAVEKGIKEKSESARPLQSRSHSH